MKKTLTLIVSLVLSLTLVACKDTKKPVELTDKDILEAAVRSVQWNGISSEEQDKVANHVSLSSESIQSGKKVVITWKADTDNVRVVGEVGKIDRSTTANTKAKVTATFTYNSEKDTKSFEFTLLQRPVDMSVENFLKAEKGVSASLTGVVTGMNGNNQYTLQDGEFAITIYDTKNKYVVGTRYLLSAVRGEKDGLLQGSNPAVLNDIESGVALPAAVNLNEEFAKEGFKVADLLKYQARLVDLSGATVKADVKPDNFGNVSFTLVKNGVEINFKWDSRAKLPGKNDADVINGLKKGDVVNVVAAPLGWSKNAVIGFSNASQIVKVAK